MNNLEQSRCCTLAALRCKIDKLENARSKIDASLARARSHYGEVTNASSPIYSLPIEILAIIFKECVNLPCDRPELNLSVTEVTRHFRSVAISTPALWTHIHILAGRTQDMDRAVAYLLRSKGLPLTISFQVEIPLSTHENVCFALNMVKHHISRWRHLQIDSNWRDGIFHCFADLTEEKASSLRSIQMNLHYSEEDDLSNRRAETCSLFDRGAPCLESVRLSGVALQCCLPPLATVRTICIDEPLLGMTTPCEKLCSMLDGLQALTHLVISGDVIENWMSTAIIELPALISLAIRVEDDTSTIPALLIALSAPALREMALESVVKEDLQPFFETLAASAPPKYPSLRFLTLGQAYHDFSQTTWHQLMHVFPAITHFTLSYHTLDDFLLALEQPYAGSNSPTEPSPGWPDLHTLTLSDYNLSAGADVRPTLLPSMVHLRTMMGHPIRKLRLSKSIVRQLRSSKQLEGLRARVEVEQCSLYSLLSPHLVKFC